MKIIIESIDFINRDVTTKDSTEPEFITTQYIVYYTAYHNNNELRGKRKHGNETILDIDKIRKDIELELK